MGLGSSGDAGVLQEGVLLLQRGEIEAAAERFRQVLQLDPANGKAQGYLGVCLVQQGQLSAGIAALQFAAQCQPYDAGAHYNLAAAQVQAQQMDQARFNLERALALDPNHAKARAALESLGPSAAAGLPQSSPDAPPGCPPPEFPGELNALPPDPLTGPPPAPLYAPSSPAAPLTIPRPDAAPTAVDPAAPHSAPAAYPAAYPPPYAPSAPMPVSPPQGMAYTAPGLQAQSPRGAAPPVGTRILRGLGWGALYGQAFTAWFMLRMVLGLGSLSGGARWEGIAVGFLVVLVVGGVVSALLGSLLGLIIAAADVTLEVGAMLGIVAGVIVLGLQALVGTRSGATLIFGLLVAFSLGRYVGANITARVRRPIPL